MKKFNVPFYFGGTALLIVVGVALDTVQQIESHLILRHYDGLVKKSQRIKGRSVGGDDCGMVVPEKASNRNDLFKDE